MNPDVYAGWVAKSLQQRASSTSTANLPVIDHHEALMRLRTVDEAPAPLDADDKELGAPVCRERPSVQFACAAPSARPVQKLLGDQRSIRFH